MNKETLLEHLNIAENSFNQCRRNCDWKDAKNWAIQLQRICQLLVLDENQKQAEAKGVIR